MSRESKLAIIWFLCAIIGTVAVVALSGREGLQPSEPGYMRDADRR